MITFPLATLAKLFQRVINDDATVFQGVSTDTRTLQPGNLFIALEGENHDGHEFVEAARQKGAVAAIVKKKVDCSLPQIEVEDTVLALGKIAQEWRNLFTIPFVGLTGSNGKTTLKNMIASILRAACNSPEEVLATEGNLNNHIGVPLMLCRLNAKHRYAVMEMGMSHFGEIEYLTNMVKPTVAAITNAATAHLQGLADVAGVARAKGEIFSGLLPSGTAILNLEDHFFSYWKGLIGKHPFISFGMKPHAEVHVTMQNTTHPLAQAITIITPQESIDLTLPLL
ncbi:MAG TPA: UDP-N-acetylmuramoyl-tripeptide--D-alanyl-D-alanine ligase, partial [Gammaproteobacteria bacterium]|nr:UDP-N-acetylmuramoyl-tripeptide--D-alanyl-D-alanine ligase [Gammaproteobacteria bacterium]